MNTIHGIAHQISSKNPREAAKWVTNFHKDNGDNATQELLIKMSNYNDDHWWLSMMHEVDEHIESLY